MRAGSAGIGDAVFNEIFHPISRRLVAKCDGCLRIGGASAGADEMVALAKSFGKPVDTALEAIPDGRFGGEVGRRHGAPVQMMQLDHGTFDDATVSVIAFDTVREIGRLAGLGPDCDDFAQTY